MSTDVVPAPGLVDQLFAELEQKIRAIRPKEDLAPLEKAFRLAAEAHKGQMRESGEPYMIHPLQVTLILADMHMDMVCLETGLLHDAVEDTSRQPRRRSARISATKWPPASTASPS